MLDRRQRIARAQLVGVAEAHTQMRRLDRDEALNEIAEVLAPFTPDVRAEILANAAAAFVDGDRHHDQASTELLAAAGAGLERARRIRGEREARPNPLASIAEQANRKTADVAGDAITITDEERQAIRARFRAKLAELDAIWTPERRAAMRDAFAATNHEGQAPEQDAASFRDRFYAELKRRGVHVSEEERQAARQWARDTLADMDAKWTPEKWDGLDQRED